MKKLFVFDFDETLTLIHTHQHEASGASDRYRDKKNTAGKRANLRNPTIIRHIIETLQKQEHVFAIASFNFGYERRKSRNDGSSFIRKYIETLLPASSPAPLIVAFEQKDRRHKASRKNAHITQLVETFNANHPGCPINLSDTTDAKRVYLIDDNEKNITEAQTLGCRTILVPSGEYSYSYLYRLYQALNVPLETIIRFKQENLNLNANEQAMLQGIINLYRGELHLTHDLAIEAPKHLTPDTIIPSSSAVAHLQNSSASSTSTSNNTSTTTSPKLPFFNMSLRSTTLDKRQHSNHQLNHLLQEASPSKKVKVPSEPSSPLQLPNFSQLGPRLDTQQFNFRPNLTINTEDSPLSSASNTSSSPRSFKLT